MARKLSISRFFLVLLFMVLVDAKDKITFYNVPDPCGIGEGPDKALWGESIALDKIFKIDPKTGRLTIYSLPEPVPGKSATSATTGSCSVVTGYDGFLYVSSSARSSLIQVNVQTGKIKIFSPESASTGESFIDITAAPDGIWITSNNPSGIIKFKYKAHTFETFEGVVADPAGIYYAPDGYIWFVESTTNVVGRINPRNDEIRIFSVNLHGISGLQTIGAERQKRYLYLTAESGGALIELDTKSEKTKIYYAPSGTPADACLIDRDVWFNTVAQNQVGQFHAKPEQISQYAIPSSMNVTTPSPREFQNVISCGPGNAVWGVQSSAKRVFKVQLG